MALDGSRSAAPVVSGCDQKPPKRTPRGADVLGTRGQENYDGGCPCESASGFRISVGWLVGRSVVCSGRGLATPWACTRAVFRPFGFSWEDLDAA